MAVTGLEQVDRRIRRAAAAAGRNPDAIRLVVVTKGRSIDDIRAVYNAGHRDFGENRAQDFIAKMVLLPGDIRWHFIGSLQRNKVRQIRPAAWMLHSLDRLELAAAWMKGPGAAPPVLLQVKTGGEPSKHGFEPDEVPAAAAAVARLGIEVRGLMTIPPPAQAPEDNRAWFRATANFGAALRGVLPSATELSMGMSDDFEVAIAEGATIVRVGRAIFEPVAGTRERG